MPFNSRLTLIWRANVFNAGALDCVGLVVVAHVDGNLLREQVRRKALSCLEGLVHIRSQLQAQHNLWCQSCMLTCPGTCIGTCAALVQRHSACRPLYSDAELVSAELRAPTPGNMHRCHMLGDLAGVRTTSACANTALAGPAARSACSSSARCRRYGSHSAPRNSVGRSMTCTAGQASARGVSPCSKPPMVICTRGSCAMDGGKYLAVMRLQKLPS